MFHSSKRFLTLLGAVVLVLTIAGCKPAQVPTPVSNTAPAPAVSNVNTTVANTNGSETTGAVKAFTIEGANFYFTQTIITVKKGDTVKIVFKSKDGLHDWVVDEFAARTKQVNKGETADVTFKADKKGTFEYYSSVQNDRGMGMKGKLIVE